MLEQLYREQIPAIKGLLRESGGLKVDARDIFQDAVMVVYHKACQPEFQLTSQFSTFFYGICRNILLNYFSKKYIISEVAFLEENTEFTDNSSLETEILQIERENLFWRSFRQLGTNCQKLLELFFQKISMEIIAVQMGFGSEGYARRRKLQCKKRLIELIKNDPTYRELI